MSSTVSLLVHPRGPFAQPRFPIVRFGAAKYARPFTLLEEDILRSPSRRALKIAAAILALVLVAAACSDDGSTTAGGTGAGGRNLSGTIRVDGSSTVAPLSEAAAELFMAENRGVRVDVATSGTSGGFQKFCIGETDMNDSSRPIKDSEVELCGQNNIGYDGIQVANDALSIIVNKDNPLDCLTVEQANQIWDEGSQVSTWGDIDGLDLPSDVVGRRITLYGPGSDSGTFDFFTGAINGEEGRIRTDYTDIGEEDQAAVLGVQGDTYAMAYTPYSFVEEAGDSIKPLEIDAGEGCVAATLDNVQDGSYTALGRPLFVYGSDTALARPEVVAFMEFYIDNAVEIAEAATFVPLTEAQKEEQLAKITRLASGTSSN
jgi:phosphate transport system substrate-binding protein